MKHRTLILSAVAGAVLVAAMMVGFAGCVQPPEKMVFVDIDGDGRVDALAVDDDGDGVPDVDADGKIKIVEGSEGYKMSELIDAIVPDALMWIGGVLGVPVLVGVGAAWKYGRFGRIFQNTVMSVQAARKKLAEEGEFAALEHVDAELRHQLPETIAAVKKAKDKLGASSVTDNIETE